MASSNTCLEGATTIFNKPNNTRKTIGCLHQFANIKTEFKEIKDRENAHKCLYWFTLNPELHPVF